MSSMTQSARGLIAGVTCALMVTATAACAGDEDQPDPDNGDSNGDELVITNLDNPEEHYDVSEFGFSVEEMDSDESLVSVSYAMVIENTHPTHAMYQDTVQVDFYGESGEIAEADAWDRVQWLPPGESMTIVRTVTSDVTPGDYDVSFDDDSFWIDHELLDLDGELTVDEELGAEISEEVLEGELEVANSFPTHLGGIIAGVVYRDDNGDIIGGGQLSDSPIELEEGDQNISFLTNSHDFVPDAADLQQTSAVLWQSHNTNQIRHIIEEAGTFELGIANSMSGSRPGK